MASALKLFGQRGFNGISTREIAVDAGVNAPALQYYFSSKEGLYRACGEAVVTGMWSCVSTAVARVDELLASRRSSKANLIAAFCDIQVGMATFICRTQQSADWLLLLAHEQVGLEADAALHLRYEKVTAKLLAVSTAVVARLLGTRTVTHETRIQAMALNSQLLMFLLLRQKLLTALRWDAFSATRMSLVLRIIRTNTQSLLQAMISAKPRR